MMAQSAQKDADHPGNLESADFRQHVQRIIRIRVMDAQGAQNGSLFALQARVRQTRAAPGDILRRTAQERACHGGGGGCVPDAHFARGNQLIPTRFHAGDRVDTRLNRLFRLRAGHRGFTRHIARSGGDAAVHRSRHGRRHTEIQRVHVRSGDGCHQVDVRRARDDGLRHECRYLAAGLAHALRHYAVVAAANQRATLVDANVRRLLNPRDLHDKLFQLSQRIQRLRDVIPPKLRLFLCVHLPSLSERAATAAISRKRAIIAS